MKVLTTILATILTTMWLGAAIDPYDLVVQEDPTSNTIVFRTILPIAKASEMAIIDNEGEYTYRNNIASDQFLNKRFRKETIGIGSFLLVFEDEDGRTVVPFEVSAQGVFADIIGAHQIPFPLVQLQQDRRLVVDYKNETGKNVNVRLTDATGQEVFSERVGGATIRRAYQLDELKAGEYMLTVSSRSVKNYTTAIELE